MRPASLWSSGLLCTDLSLRCGGKSQAQGIMHSRMASNAEGQVRPASLCGARHASLLPTLSTASKDTAVERRPAPQPHTGGKESILESHDSHTYYSPLMMYHMKSCSLTQRVCR